MGLLAALNEAFEGAASPLRAHRGQRSMEIQSVLFDRRIWTEAKAKRWLKREGMRYGKVDVTDRYLRYRQQDPDKFSIKRTIQLGDDTGIKAIVGR